MSHPAASLLAIAFFATLPACAVVEKIDKIGKIPGLEQAEVTRGLDDTSQPMLASGPASPLRATPRVLDFGPARSASSNQQTVTISNPSTFAVTVVRIDVQGCGFALGPQVVDGTVVPARGAVALTVIFQPATRQSCSGVLLLEIDSAGGRFTRVPLKGRGV